jgi:AAA+ superfamily predicted ATPase
MNPIPTRVQTAAVDAALLRLQKPGVVAIVSEPGLGARFVGLDEILRVVSGVLPERADFAVHRLLEDALRTGDGIAIDDFSNLMHNGGGGFPVLGTRAMYFQRFLIPALWKQARAAGKRVILSGAVPTDRRGLSDHSVDRLYGVADAEVVTLAAMEAEDYRRILGNWMQATQVDAIDVERIHSAAPYMTCYQLRDIARACNASGTSRPTTETVLEQVQRVGVRSNTRTQEVEALRFDDLPGAEHITSKLETHVLMPLEADEALGLRPKRGVLLYGPPGTGKTSIGRALAHRMKGKFFLLDGSFVTDWPGFFFARVEHLIREAQANAPSVVFIDDADVLFTIPHIAGLPRLLLTLLDGIEGDRANKVCVMMTAMDPRKIPDAVLRSGRVELWLGTRTPDADARARIIRKWMPATLPKLDRADYAHLSAITQGCTPADLRRLAEDARSIHAFDTVKAHPLQSAQDYYERAVQINLESRRLMQDAKLELATAV